MFCIYCCNNLNKKKDKMYLKIKKDSTLFDLRNILENKRNFYSLFFLKENKTFVPKEEEMNIKIIEAYKNKIVFFTDVPYIKIKLEGEYLCDINFDNISLDVLRINLAEKINSKNKFFYNNAFILDEENFKVFDICKNNEIEINQISDNLFNKLIQNEIIQDKKMNIIEEDKIISNDINQTFNKENLDETNENIKKENFLNNIQKSKPIKIMPKDNNIKLIKDNSIEGEKNQSISPNIIITNKKMNRYKSLDPNKRKGKKENLIKYYIYIDNEIKEDFPFFECNPENSVKQLRENLPSKYNDYKFLYDGFPILDESSKISEIAKGNKIYLKKININNNIIKNLKKINKKSIYEYYLYPNVKFNNEEEKESISILLLGETGTGKSTFLNSLVNFVLKVKYTDNFRYLIINEENSNQYLSQTKGVNIYYIKGHNSFPPIKIIDTPGFGDTSGKEFDKKIVRMIFQKFMEIKELNSIFIFCKYNEGRLDSSQRYVFNYIIDLFGKDMIENFLILFTFCDNGEIISKKCFECENSPFYNILNRVNEPWYLKFNNSGFFSEKKNEIIKNFFEFGLESFIKLFNKLKSLKKVKLELSLEVNIKREKLDKISSYIEKQILNLINIINNENINSNKEQKFYYCSECKVFSDSLQCIFGDHNIINPEYGNVYFNFKDYPINGTIKKYFELYCNFFQFEKLMEEYNNITIRCYKETLNDFIIKINQENKFKAIEKKIAKFKDNYENYKNSFYSKKQIKDFPIFLFNILINRKN